MEVHFNGPNTYIQGVWIKQLHGKGWKGNAWAIKVKLFNARKIIKTKLLKLPTV